VPSFGSSKLDGLRSAFGFFDCEFGALEADLAMGAIAERLVDGSSATTQREGSFASEVELIAVYVNQLD